MTGQSIAISLSELLAEHPEVRQPMMGSWLLERSLNMVHAPAGLGKSMWCMALAIALAGGGEFLRWKARKPRRVLYVDAEMDRGDIHQRARALLKASGMTQEQKLMATDNIQIVSQQSLKEGSQLPDLSNDTEAATEVLTELVRAQGSDFVILDNLSTLADIDDENSAGGFSFVHTIGRALQREGAAVLFVHHDRKGMGGSESFRGSSKLEAPLDVRWGLRKPETALLGASLAFTLECHKCRPRRGEDVRSFTAGLIDDDGNSRWMTSDNPLPENLRVFLEAVRSELYSSGGGIAAALDVSKGTVSKYKAKAIAGGWLTEDEYRDCLARAVSQEDF